jgi:hypothetical protein
MQLQAPRAVVLVCDAAAADGPAVGSECAGYVVVACFTCTERCLSEAVLRELAQVADALRVDDALVLTAVGAGGDQRVRRAVIPLARNDADGRPKQR